MKGDELKAFEKDISDYLLKSVKDIPIHFTMESGLFLAIKFKVNYEAKPVALVTNLKASYRPKSKIGDTETPNSYSLQSIVFGDSNSYSGREPVTLTVEHRVSKEDEAFLNEWIEKNMIDYYRFMKDYRKKLVKSTEKDPKLTPEAIVEKLYDAQRVIESHFLSLSSLQSKSIEEEIRSQRKEIADFIEAVKRR